MHRLDAIEIFPWRGQDGMNVWVEMTDEIALIRPRESCRQVLQSGKTFVRHLNGEGLDMWVRREASS